MKKLPILLLLTAPYVLLGCVLFGLCVGFTSGAGMLVAAGLIYFGAAVCISLVYPFAWQHHGYSAQQLAFQDMLLKLCHIPFYVSVFLICLITNVFIIPALPALFLIDALLLLASSMYGISALRLCRKNGAIAKLPFAIHAAAHFIFCIDVISAVCCYRKLRRLADFQPKAE